MTGNFSRDETECGAFGDAWGASLSASVNVKAPAVAAPSVLRTTGSVAAPKVAVPSFAAPAPKVALNASLSSAVASAGRAAPTTLLPSLLASQVATKTPIIARPSTASTAALMAAAKPMLAPVKPAPTVPTAPSSSGPSAALQGNFLDGGTLTAPAVKPPAQKLTDKLVSIANATKQQPASNAAAVSAAAAKTSAINAQYRADRQASTADYLAGVEVPFQAWQKQYDKDHPIDWGLIPLGAAVLASGAAVIGTAGAAAGAIAAGGVSAATIGSVVTADGVVAAAAKAGSKDAAKAKNVIDTTRALAAGGDVDAKKGLTVIAAVTADRAQKGVPAGVTQSVDALLPLATNPIVAGASAGGLGVRPDPAPSAFLTADQLTAAPRVTRTASDKLLRWSVLDGGQIYRGAAPVGAGPQYRVYDSGRVEQAIT